MNNSRLSLLPRQPHLYDGWQLIKKKEDRKNSQPAVRGVTAVNATDKTKCTSVVKFLAALESVLCVRPDTGCATLTILEVHGRDTVRHEYKELGYDVKFVVYRLKHNLNHMTYVNRISAQESVGRFGDVGGSSRHAVRRSFQTSDWRNFSAGYLFGHNTITKRHPCTWPMVQCRNTLNVSFLVVIFIGRK